MSGGLPNTSSLDTYGGPKGDYLIEVTDPTTDREHTEVDQAFADCAAMTSTSPRAILLLTFVGATAPTLSSSATHWPTAGNTAPVVARTSAGVYTVTFPPTIVDALGATQSLGIRFVVSYTLSSIAYVASVVRTSASVVTITVSAYDTHIVADPSGPTLTIALA